jgi:hypothetical protein
MTTELTRQAGPEPTWRETPRLSLSLKSHDLDKHRAWIAVKSEAVLGGYWQTTPPAVVKAEMIAGWMDALQDYTKPEIIRAFSLHVSDNPNKRPNEGHIRQIILSNRAAEIAAEPKAPEPPRPAPATPEQAAKILAEVGFQPRKFSEYGNYGENNPPVGSK